MLNSKYVQIQIYSNSKFHIQIWKSVQCEICLDSNLFKFKTVLNLKTVQIKTVRVLNCSNLNLFRSKRKRKNRKKNEKMREKKQKKKTK
jgi:hypothetical protein